MRLAVYVVPTGPASIRLVARRGCSRPLPSLPTLFHQNISLISYTRVTLQTMHRTHQRRYSKWLSTSTVIECWLSWRKLLYLASTVHRSSRYSTSTIHSSIHPHQSDGAFQGMGGLAGPVPHLMPPAETKLFRRACSCPPTRRRCSPFSTGRDGPSCIPGHHRR